ncbi:MAG TPA: TIGR03088 family PEP-CTERM/XrtA system glycosyltransferase [Steroidobacteraceae bacterium]|nr:TIGR03088 family PEP-CTERM/XrtA system glycosyltransferase [Steroidobacteraceae bacterium]
MTPARDPRPLIAHIVFRFDYGGLENGVVNVINGLPEDAFRHTVIALTECTDFKARIRRQDVPVHALGKQAGKDPGAYLRLYRLLRKIRPDITHSRNLATLESAVVARLAGVPQRIHGEHGWDIYDPDGTNRKYRAMRRLASPAIGRFVTVSRELEKWLTDFVGIRASKITRICNGVDTERFRRIEGAPRTLLPEPLRAPGTVVFGSVLRFSPIKDPLNLVRAFIAARRDASGGSIRLAMIGDGAIRADAERLLREAGLAQDAWLPGARDDVPALLREMDVYVLGSLREGISNTVLESMSTGLPVIATRTGGNIELVNDGVTGRLITPGSPDELAAAMLAYARDSNMRRAHGAAARERIEQEYSLRRMLRDYDALYRACSVQVGEAA